MKITNAIKRLTKLGFSIDRLNETRTIATKVGSKYELGLQCNSSSDNISIIWVENTNDRDDAMTDYFGGTEYFKTLKAAIKWAS